MPKTSFGNPLISEFIYETPKKILCTETKTISSQNALFRFFEPVIAKMFLSRSFKRPEAEYKCVARLYNHDKWLNLRKRGEGRWGRGVLHLISLDVPPVKMQLKEYPGRSTSVSKHDCLRNKLTTFTVTTMVHSCIKKEKSRIDKCFM